MSEFAEFRLILVGILVEALPFIVIASLIGLLFELFVPEDGFRRLFSGRLIAGTLIAAASGFINPICECCIIPITRKLIDRGVPVPVALTFMLAGPSLGPIVLASTSIAFATHPSILYWRVGLALALVAAMAVVFMALDRRHALEVPGREADSACHDHDHDHALDHDRAHHQLAVGFGDRARAGLEEAVGDFFKMAGYMTMASILTAAIKVFTPASLMESVGANSFISVPAMMSFSFITSTCSDADAFIAAAMHGFTPASMLAFLLLGPVLDLKLTIMHYAFLPRRVATTLLIVCPILVVVAVVFASFFF